MRSDMSATAKRTNPALWERVKAKITRGSKGGRSGQWSARKAQMAVNAYKAIAAGAFRQARVILQRDTALPTSGT
jgi:hypothetical protein